MASNIFACAVITAAALLSTAQRRRSCHRLRIRQNTSAPIMTFGIQSRDVVSSSGSISKCCDSRNGPRSRVICRGRPAYWLVVFCWMWCASASLMLAQQPGPKEQKPEAAKEGPTVREVGGRLVASGWDLRWAPDGSPADSTRVGVEAASGAGPGPILGARPQSNKVRRRGSAGGGSGRPSKARSSRTVAGAWPA